MCVYIYICLYIYIYTQLVIVCVCIYIYQNCVIVHPVGVRPVRGEIEEVIVISQVWGDEGLH